MSSTAQEPGACSFHPDKNMPGCMMPDGGDCCAAYAALVTDWHRLRRTLAAPLDTPSRDGIASTIGYYLASIVSGNNQPHMSGDPRDRISPLRRKHFDEACQSAADAILAALPPPADGPPISPGVNSSLPSGESDPVVKQDCTGADTGQLREAQYKNTCDDPRLLAAGYKVCGSGGDTQWHWHGPDGKWHDGYKTEYTAVKAALAALQPPKSGGTEP